MAKLTELLSTSEQRNQILQHVLDDKQAQVDMECCAAKLIQDELTGAQQLAVKLSEQRKSDFSGLEKTKEAVERQVKITFYFLDVYKCCTFIALIKSEIP